MSQQEIEPGQMRAFSAPTGVRAAIGRIGRTEDVRFSPDGRRLALPGLKTNRLLVLDIEVDVHADPPAVALTGFLELESEDFGAPHGIAWVDGETLIVANREGCVSIIQVPVGQRGTSIPVQAVRRIGVDATDLVKTPGSVSVRPAGMGLVELLVCNNYVDHVTRHLLDRRRGCQPLASEILLDGGIKVPDGIAQSPSGRWIAVSNHDHRNVLLYRSDEQLGRGSKPQGVLSGICYPHGLRFSADERALLVADAGAPCVLLFRSEEGDWSGPRDPSQSIRVLDDAAFRRGNITPQEGGPKGIDLSPDSRLMVVSCESQPLAFFDMREVLGPVVGAAHSFADVSEEERARKVMLRYLASARLAAQQESEAIRRGTAYDREALIARQLEMRRLLTSRSWRLTAPLRTLNAAIQRLRRDQ